MIDKRLQVFKLNINLEEIGSIKPSPWVYQDSVRFPRCMWETILKMFEYEFGDKYMSLDAYSKLSFNEKKIDNIELTDLANSLFSVRNAVDDETLLRIHQDRVKNKLDFDYEIEEYEDLINIIGGILLHVSTKNEELQSWID